MTKQDFFWILERTRGRPTICLEDFGDGWKSAYAVGVMMRADLVPTRDRHGKGIAMRFARRCVLQTFQGGQVNQIDKNQAADDRAHAALERYQTWLTEYQENHNEGGVA